MSPVYPAGAPAKVLEPSAGGCSSATLFEEARRRIPGGVNSSTRALVPPVVWKHAVGSHLFDVDGNAHLDYHAAFGPILLGHNHPAVNLAVVKSLQAVDLVGVGVTELEIRLAAKLCQHIPSAERVLLCNSGSEATYNAVRLARAATGRRKLIKFQGCYHGWHDYVCMNVISPAEKLGRHDPASAGMLEASVNHTVVLNFNRLEEVEVTLQRERDSVAAIILEPIPHNIGCVLPKPEFLAGIRELATQYGVVLIFDEVITGFRHGLGGYQKVCGVIPDLTTLAKSMANGYPCAALAGKAELMERFQTAGGDVFFAGTYNGHPVGVAAALATIEELEHGQIYDSLFRDGLWLADELGFLFRRYGIRGHIAHFGSVVVPYFMEAPAETYTDLLRNDTERDIRFRRQMIARGIFMLPLALKRNHVMASHTRADLARTLEAAENVLKGF